MKRILISLFVTLALFSTATAQTRQEKYDFKGRMRALFSAWESLDPSKAAPFYAKDSDAVFFDVAPLKYKNWDEYAAGVKVQFAPFASAKWNLHDDIQVHTAGRTAWGTATWNGELTKKDGSKMNLEGRYTCVWERRGGEWLLVHEHMSVPLGESK